MSLRLKFIAYLIIIHLLFAGVAIYLLLQNRIWLLAVEAVFVISLLIGIAIIKNFFGTIELINTGAQFLSDSDFTARFREVGQKELDQLIHIYNRMIDHLRDERIKLQEQNYFLDKIMKASPSGIITFDFDKRIAMVNPCAEQMLQSATANLLGKKLNEIQTPFTDELDELSIGEARVMNLTGRRRIKCQRSQFLDRGFTRDFILMEELTEELRQSEKTAYEKLIRLMSHEVNNSVGSANSLLHSCLLYKDQLAEDDRRDFETALSVVISRTDQLNRFMKSFADVVRLSEPHRAVCDVVQLVKGITVFMREDLARRHIKLNWEMQTPIADIALDRTQMEQVFVNVLKNAMEAIGERGVITIRTGMAAGRWFIAIEDTGSGIAPEVQSQLFTPFFSTKENGQGIGLTMVQEILDNHRFDFSLVSEPGKATQFTIWF
ncbi:MAG: ATP-binding protein [Acidobacteriota bacterium]